MQICLVFNLKTGSITVLKVIVFLNSWNPLCPLILQLQINCFKKFVHSSVIFVFYGRCLLFPDRYWILNSRHSWNKPFTRFIQTEGVNIEGAICCKDCIALWGKCVILGYTNKFDLTMVTNTFWGILTSC